MPFGFPGAAVALMVVHQALIERSSQMAGEAGQGTQMLGDLGVALVRHRNAAHRARHQAFAQFGDLAALQVVDLVADAVGRAAEQRQQVAPFGVYVAAVGPGNCRSLQTQTLRKSGLHLQAARPQ